MLLTKNCNETVIDPCFQQTAEVNITFLQRNIIKVGFTGEPPRLLLYDLNRMINKDYRYLFKR